MVGYTLRQERERQNLSINDIEQGTSIRAIYIEAIENGEYDKLPGKVYTKGFIKNYAKFLGLDADAMAKEFAADIAELYPAEEPPPTEGETAQATDKPVEVKPVTPIKQQEKKPLGHSIQQEGRNLPNIPIIAAVVLLVMLAAGAGFLLGGSGENVAKVDPPVQQEQNVTPTESPPEDNSTPVANANPIPQPPSDSVAIQARFNDRCWVLVTVDGTVVQEGVVDGGQTLSWEGKDNITFRLGNAGAVEFFQNGKSLGVLGGIGDIADKTFTRS